MRARLAVKATVPAVMLFCWLGFGATAATATTTLPCATTGESDVCLLTATGNTLNANGGQRGIDVQNGKIVVNSTDSAAEQASGGSYVDAKDGNFEAGGYTATGGSVFNPIPVSGYVTTNPFAPITGTEPAGQCYTSSSNTTPVGSPGSCTVSGSSTTYYAAPGTYSTLAAMGNGTLYLEPGNYVITNSLTASPGTIIGAGVTIHFTGNASANFQGGSTVQLADPSGPNGILFYYDTSDTNNSGLDIGPASVVLDGQVVGAGIGVLVQGNPPNYGDITGTLLADSLNVHSSGLLTVGCPPSAPVKMSARKPSKKQPNACVAAALRHLKHQQHKRHHK